MVTKVKTTPHLQFSSQVIYLAVQVSDLKTFASKWRSVEKLEF